MEMFALFLYRVRCWWGVLGLNPAPDDYYVGPITAWRVACAIHPWDHIEKMWWLRTGHIKVGPKKFWTVC